MHYKGKLADTVEQMVRDNLTPEKVKNYLIFLRILGIMFSLIAIRGDYILAPPYAVSSYLVVFQRNTKYSSRESLTATYALVIISSDALHFLLGESLVGMTENQFSKKSGSCSCRVFSLENLTKASIMGETEGIIQLTIFFYDQGCCEQS